MPISEKTLNPGQPGWALSLARKLVLKHLHALDHGGLIIEEPDGHCLLIGEKHGAGVIRLQQWSVYAMMLSGGALGAAEAYMEEAWTSPDLVAVVRFFAANINRMRELEGGLATLSKPALAWLHRHNRNSLRGSRRNIAAHYDLGNDFFALFLDRSMMYSSAMYPSAEATLEQAATHKLDVICRKLDLQPGMELLEIGTGWGGLALHAARHYDVNVTTTTISQQQARFAREQVAKAGLQSQITVLEDDYRELSGQFDRVVSIEMIEAVGADYLDSYFQVLGQRVKPDGLVLLQAITVPDQRYRYALKQVDFIKRYIFPGGFLPSVSVMGEKMARHSDLVITDLDDIGRDYARTLHHWRERFLQAMPAITRLGFDQRFLRMWDYYLCYCEGAFLERAVSTVHVLAAAPEYRPAP